MMDNLHYVNIIIHKRMNYYDGLYGDMNDIINSCISKHLGSSNFLNNNGNWEHALHFNPLDGLLISELNKEISVDEKELNKMMLSNSDCRIYRRKHSTTYEIYRNLTDENDSGIIMRLHQDFRPNIEEITEDESR